jgi:hypothetical protein
VKLNLLFVVMDLFTLLAYSIVYVHTKPGQLSGSKKRIPSVILQNTEMTEWQEEQAMNRP